MFVTLAIITATVVGIMVGVEFCGAVFVDPILLRLPVGTALEASPQFGRVVGRVMPFWYIASLILTIALAVVIWGTPPAGAAVAAAILLAISVVISVTVLVPINNRTKTWTVEDHPEDWREQQLRWHRVHYARVAIIVAAFVLTLVAAIIRP
jgi:uncharacterized membrane protein